MDWKELRVDVESPLPLYRQLSERIGDRIRTGRLAEGSRLPPTRELADVLRLNRTTVAAAYQLLASEGLLDAHVGRGSFVRSPAPPAPPLDWEQKFRPAAADGGAERLPWPPGEDFINFASVPADPGGTLLGALRRAAERELSRPGAAILQLGPAEGHPPLRKYLHSQMRAAGIAGPDDEVLITSGCQQGLDLLAKILVAPGQAVLLEDPVYPGARQVFLAAGAQVRGVPMGPEGISLPELELELARLRPSLLLVTPNFQNPTGATLGVQARREILRLAARFQTVVVENDVYSGLRYQGEELPSLKSLDGDGRVVYLRSFSKIAFPGLRVGWCVARRAVARRLAAAKQLTDLHTDQLSQAILHRLAAEGTLRRHLEELVRLGKRRLRAVAEACRAEMPPGARFHTPEGGLHLWLELPSAVDSGELLARARAAKILFVPGKLFEVSRPQGGALRLTFAGLPPEQIRRGVSTLARLIPRREAVEADLAGAGLPALV